MAETIEYQDAVYALAASPAFAEDGTCFAGRASGVYRSCDGGAHWEYAYRALDLQIDLLTSALALSPNFPSDRTVFSGSSGGMLRSYDAGATWHVNPLPAPPCVVSCLAFSPHYAADDIAFLATLEDGVYRSSNQGQTWARWNFGLFDLRVLSLALSPDFAHDETLFAGTVTGLYVSRNSGRSWHVVPLPDPLAPVLSLALSPHFARDGTLFAGTESDGLWISADRGLTWERLGGESVTGSVNALLVAPGPSTALRLLALADGGVFVSGDSGQTWANLGVDRPGDSPESIAEPTAVVAPSGLADGMPLLLGLDDGRVIRLEVPIV